ncbi:hypothetical protein LTR02_005073 [Friedmanniomyces endolithicus]|nr:hypothetical protein LTR94_006622 [Friedmanniomyces endolithicus]KAK0795123.1 hypothetical protein LTR59_007517 [Friedmanniomyces endolithicus]KAK0802001.1 hypothetical protein LTR38_006575 [Friedmanniomyces endolithicus]KAK0820728.1 hypothetical protein LTR75_001313 [Friedmanniomyces endolithicus]KAK0846567.1 hypothetical protein LTR03_006844 [Friedmanniomyces endolithicus]
MNCLARRARFFEQPIHQSVAESCAPGSFCGDVTHLRPPRISDCSAEKSLQLYKEDASYSIIHDLELPWSVIPEPKLAAPLVLPPSQWSRKMLKVCVDSEEAEYAKGVARVMEERKAAAPAIGVLQADVDPPKLLSVTAATLLSGDAAEIHDAAVFCSSTSTPPDADINENFPVLSHASTAAEQPTTSARPLDSKPADQVPEAEPAKTTASETENPGTVSTGYKTKASGSCIDDDEDWVEVNCDEVGGKEPEEVQYVLITLRKSAQACVRRNHYGSTLRRKYGRLLAAAWLSPRSCASPCAAVPEIPPVGTPSLKRTSIPAPDQVTGGTAEIAPIAGVPTPYSKIEAASTTAPNMASSTVLGKSSEAVRAAKPVNATDILVKPADVLKVTTTTTMITGKNEADAKYLDEDDGSEL